MSRTHRLLTTGTIGLFGGQLDHARTHHRQLFDILHHFASWSQPTATVWTGRQRDYEFFIHMVWNGAARTRMPRGASGLFGIARSLLLFNPKGSSLTCGFGLQLSHFGRQTAVAIIEVFDLLLQLLNFLGKFFNRLSLTQNDLNKFLRLLTQGLQCRSQWR
jgi:hypothetical protein